MKIGAARIVLDFYNNDDAGLKRKQLEKVCKDLRKKFNISALEIEDFEEPERGVIGFAVVIPTHWKPAASRSFLEKICNVIDESVPARVVIEDTDLLEMGE